MPDIVITKEPTISYYRTYEAIKRLGLTTEQAIEEINELYIETLNGK